MVSSHCHLEDLLIETIEINGILISSLVTCAQVNSFTAFTGVFFLNFQHPKGHQPFLETKMLFGNTSYHHVPIGGLDHIFSSIGIFAFVIPMSKRSSNLSMASSQLFGLSQPNKAFSFSLILHWSSTIADGLILEFVPKT